MSHHCHRNYVKRRSLLSELITLRITKTYRHFYVRVARLQNEIVPEIFLIRYEKGFENAKKRIRKTIRNVSEKFLAPLRPLQNISPALSKMFSPPKFCATNIRITATFCRGGHAKFLFSELLPPQTYTYTFPLCQN